MTTEPMKTDITPGFEDWANHMGLATKKDLANVSTGGEDGASGTTTWDSISDKPATFPPATHTHKVADLSDYAVPDLSKYVLKTDYDALVARVTALESA